MKSLLRSIRNLFRLLRHPKLIVPYINWMQAGGNPVVTYFNGAKVSGFISFSEYHYWRRGLDAEDIAVISYMSENYPASTVIDVGANLGFFSMALAKGKFAEVHSFEPVPPTFEKLTSNANLNSPHLAELILNQAGLGAEPGVFSFITDPKSPQQNKLNFNQKDKTDSNLTDCQVTTLDDYCRLKHIHKISFLKIDVEGFETHVLKGGKETLINGEVRFIYSEIIAEAFTNAGSSQEEFCQTVEAYGFHPVIFDPAHSNTLKKVIFSEALHQSGLRRNVLFRHERYDQ